MPSVKLWVGYLFCVFPFRFAQIIHIVFLFVIETLRGVILLWEHHLIELGLHHEGVQQLIILESCEVFWFFGSIICIWKHDLVKILSHHLHGELRHGKLLLLGLIWKKMLGEHRVLHEHAHVHCWIEQIERIVGIKMKIRHILVELHRIH